MGIDPDAHRVRDPPRRGDRGKEGAMGYLYRPTLKGGRGNSRIWWVKYYVNGRPVRERTGADRESEARRFLKEREGRVATGQPLLPQTDRIRYEEIDQDLRAHYRATGSRNLTEVEKRLKHLDQFFAGQRVSSIAGADAAAYVVKRQTAGVANGTINRELATLGRMLRLAYENGKLLRLPVIRKLKEAPPRQGFFEREQFEAVRRHLPAGLQLAVSIGYAFGWRMQSEVLTLARRQLDLQAGTLV